MSGLLGPLLLKSGRVWGWFVPKTFQGLHFLFSGSLSWWIAIWVICPWNKFEEKKQCELEYNSLINRPFFCKHKLKTDNYIFFRPKYQTICQFLIHQLSWISMTSKKVPAHIFKIASNQSELQYKSLFFSITVFPRLVSAKTILFWIFKL